MKPIIFCVALALFSACSKSKEYKGPTYNGDFRHNCQGCNVMGGGVAKIIYFTNAQDKEDSIMTTSLPSQFRIGDVIVIGFQYADAPDIMVQNDKVYPRTAKILSVKKQ